MSFTQEARPVHAFVATHRPPTPEEHTQSAQRTQHPCAVTRERPQKSLKILTAISGASHIVRQQASAPLRHSGAHSTPNRHATCDLLAGLGSPPRVSGLITTVNSCCLRCSHSGPGSHVECCRTRTHTRKQLRVRRNSNPKHCKVPKYHTLCTAQLPLPTVTHTHLLNLKQLPCGAPPTPHPPQLPDAHPAPPAPS